MENCISPLFILEEGNVFSCAIKLAVAFVQTAQLVQIAHLAQIMFPDLWKLLKTAIAALYSRHLRMGSIGWVVPIFLKKLNMPVL